jgi:hypothetical protein
MAGLVDPVGSLDRVARPTDPWLVRRMHAWGASELPALLVALGRRAPESAPGYVRDNAKRIRTRAGVFPRIVLEKAGARAPLAAGDAARIGSAREPDLLRAWAATLTDADVLDASTVTHSSSVPRWLWPVVDRRCHRLAVSLDAWCSDVVGEHVPIELKCGRVQRPECPWHWRIQVQAQMAATDASLAVVVCGQGWSRSMEATGSIDAWPVERDDAAIAELREACAEGWAMVEKIAAMLPQEESA